jgi:hypothetical protein
MIEVSALPPARARTSRLRRTTAGMVFALALLHPARADLDQVLALSPGLNSMEMQQAKAIGLAMFQYATDHDGAYPTGKSSTEVFQQLLDGQYAPEPALFWVNLPGKTKPASRTLKPENVCFDVTTPVDANSPDALPLVFLTGYKVSYVAGGSAVPAFTSSQGRPLGITVCYKSNRAIFIRKSALPDGSIPNFVPADFDPAGKTYRQLTP